ncbi:hypothetical protein V8B55DRAFT_1513020 [Mucor lusitanicus]|uniref:Zinc finger protein 830 n=1 Tax=Mucor circinelloides f. lusitanicus TaxID=29924 RepID=A0A8H4BLC8_MUCCL|nr:hypothetical protein FB192DRAFT_1091757 [Mucor lusitanicus]
MPPKADVRRLLKKQQQERNKVAKITHPFAKYDQANRLVCVVCNSHVKSESVWQAHLGSQLHRDNIQKLKELKQQQQQQLKRRATSSSPPTSSSQPSDSKRMRLDEEQTRQDIELSQDESDQEQEDEEMGLPADFFDKQEEDEEEDIPKEVEETPVATDKKDSKSLPSGFFDDPEEEARVQGTLAPEDQAKADLEREVEMFNEAMMDVTEESKQVQEEDDETFWEERHLDITREQAKFDSRVEKLKQLRQTGHTKMVIDEQHVQEEYDNDDGIKTGLKTSVRQVLKTKPTKQVASMFDDDEEDSDQEDDEDWRAQQL